MATFGQQPPGLASMPLVAMSQKCYQFIVRLRGQIELAGTMAALGSNAPYASVRLIPRVFGNDVIRALIVPIGHVHGAVGPAQTIDWPKPYVVRLEQRALKARAVCRAIRFELTPVDRVGEQIRGNVGVAERLRESIPLVYD